MPEYPAFDEEAFDDSGFVYSFAVAAAASAEGGGQVERLRVYRRTPFLDHMLVTASIQKPFEEQLILDADLVHRFNECIYLAATPVKPFSESLYLAGAINVMEWLYPSLETTKEVKEG